MHKTLLQILFLLNLVILNHAFESHGENVYNRQVYNLHNLIEKSLNHLQNSHRLNDESPNSVIDLHNKSIYQDFLVNLDLNSFSNSSKCADDILYILQNIKNQWALSVFDSFGKPKSGILQGHFKWIGDYNECIQVQSTNKNSTVGNFRGKYCSLTTSSPLPNITLPIPLMIGLCVPDSCTTEELQSFLQFSRGGNVSALNNTQDASSTSIQCKPTERHLNIPAKVVIALLSIFCTLAVLGSSVTAVKYFKKIIKESKVSLLTVNASETDLISDGNIKENSPQSDDESLLKDNASISNENGLLKFLQCFCIFTNGAKILNTDSSEGQLLCIHGIRFLSMTWVILGHSYLFGYSSTGNIIEAVKSLDNIAFEIVLQGFYSVDSFFVLSGFLLTYLAMKEFAKTKGVIAWPYFYIHRYVRLTPIYMVILGFSATVYFYMGSGPFWPDFDTDPNCKDHWWWNLLYISNFKSMTNQCMGWSWYLANDMQFFVISPLFLITLWRWPKVGYGLLATFLCVSFISNFWITYHYELTTGMSGIVGGIGNAGMTDMMPKYTMYFDKIYVKPYTRIGPYLIGILVGYVLFKRKASGKPKHSWVFITIGWVVATAVTLACIYGLYHNNPTLVVTSFYNAVNRTCFAAGLSWVIYVCLIGQGGIVNSILSYKFFIPLSRLTYTAYLIHPMIMNGYFLSLKTSLEFSHPTVVLLFLSYIVVTYALSLPIALVLESPIVSLEKLVRKSFSRKENS